LYSKLQAPCPAFSDPPGSSKTPSTDTNSVTTTLPIWTTPSVLRFYLGRADRAKLIAAGPRWSALLGLQHLRVVEQNTSISPCSRCNSTQSFLVVVARLAVVLVDRLKEA